MNRSLYIARKYTKKKVQCIGGSFRNYLHNETRIDTLRSIGQICNRLVEKVNSSFFSCILTELFPYQSIQATISAFLNSLPALPDRAFPIGCRHVWKKTHVTVFSIGFGYVSLN